jgi:hypothetical protein
MRFYLGPMSKNIVDAILDYSKKYGNEFTFIPSRRQVDKQGGYVNKWTTKEFCEYVRSYNLSTITIERDHGGPGQGDCDDDGIESLLEDCLYMDYLHIDPWKRYPIYEEALTWTVKLIETCYAKNPQIFYEVGTEEGIRPISVEVLDTFCQDLKRRLHPDIFKQIKYIVVQCGTQLLEKENIGNFDKDKLLTMLNVAEKYGLIAKEHNGDWVSQSVIQEKKSLGLQHINIAPELGEYETKIVLEKIRQNPDALEKFYKLCLQSGRWKKWVSNDFEPEKNKEKLILISGHYVFSHPEFLQLKSQFVDIDVEIQEAIQRKLHEYLHVFSVRDSCIFCSSPSLQDFFKKDKRIAMSYALLKETQNGYFIPYNIQHCEDCHAIQTKYTGDLSLVYSINHIDNFGAVKNRMHDFFASFILENPLVINTVEIGACHDHLSRLLLTKRPKNNVHIIDPYFTGNADGLTLISDYLENFPLTSIPVNTVLMSSVFEHFYNPREVLEKLKASPNIQYIYLNHPELEYSIKNDIYINLTTEHTFYIENQYLIDLFQQYGFVLTKKKSFETHTTCFEFTRKLDRLPPKIICNRNSVQDIKKYVLRLDQKIKNMNTFMCENPQYDFYVWPASMHLTPIFTHGFDTHKIKGLLDNSPNKIGKFFYGYNLPCHSFAEVVKNAKENTCIFLGGSPLYRQELIVQNKHCKFYEI